MAGETDQWGNPLVQRSGTQAALGFGSGANRFSGSQVQYSGPPRPRFMFMVRFVRAGAQGGSRWMNGMSFAVKTIDRPTVTPEIKTLDQYNKKRLVHTGIKYGPIQLSFHDTVDSSVMGMWAEYAQHYFGDFRQTGEEPWGYDIVNGEMINPATGFGFSPKLSSSADNTTTAGYFFSHVECYQFYAGEFIRFDLINPKISSFNPDAMDYQTGETHVINMTLEYEAIHYHNGNKPVSISTDSTLTQWFAQNWGQTFEPFSLPQDYLPTTVTADPTAEATARLASSEESLFGIASGLLASAVQGNLSDTLKNAGNQITRGALGSFGQFAFGNNNALSQTFNGAVIPALMSGQTSNLGTASAASVFGALSRTPSQVLSSSSNGPSKGISSSLFGAAIGVLGGSSKNSTVTSSIAGAVAASAQLQGKQPGDIVNTSNGVAMDSTSLAIFNATRPSYSQMGIRSDNPSTGGSSFDPNSI